MTTPPTTLTPSNLKRYDLDDLDTSKESDALARLRAALESPYAPPLGAELTTRYAGAQIPKTLKGGIGFFLFSDIAGKWTNREDTPEHRQCNALLRDPDVIDYIFSTYNIHDDFRDGSLTLHRVGSTSFILAFHDGAPFPRHVLKLVKPQHWSNPAVRLALYEALKEFSLEGLDDFTPDYDKKLSLEVTISGVDTRLYLAMSFLKGRTVGEEFERASQLAGKDRADACMALARQLAEHLCENLGRLAPQLHRDLSPENLILSDSRRSPLCMIDFGVNHTLRGAARGSGQLILRAARYVAPEIRDAPDKPARDTPSADLYSSGVILLELLAGCDQELAFTKPDEFVRVLSSAPVLLLDRVRRINPGMSHILEGLVDDNATTRAFERLDVAAKDNNHRKMYKTLQSDLLAAIREYGVECDRQWLPRWRQVVGHTPASDVSPQAMLNALRGLSSEPDEVLATCRSVCLGLTISLAVYGGYRVYQAIQVTQAVLIGAPVVNSPFGTLGLQSIWSGLIVAITFLFVASKYYMSLYSRVSARNLGVGELVMRANAFSFALPIFYTLYVDASAWAICSAVGVCIVSINNHFVDRLAKDANKNLCAPNLDVPRPSAYGSFLTQFDGWFQMTAAYVVVLVLMQAGLWLGRSNPQSAFGLQDEWFYAAVIVMFNVKMFVYNCTSEAPQVRTCLMWATDNLRRARVYRDRYPERFEAEPVA